MTPQPPHTLIIGAGLAGLTAAVTLSKHDARVTLIDAADQPGGRVRTDTINNFRIDRGFQILLTAYPETQQLLDYNALDLQPFNPGALVHQAGAFTRFADPRKNPITAVRSLLGRSAFIADGPRTLRYLTAKPNAHNTSARDDLEQRRFSATFRHAFLRPFFAGVLFDDHLHTDANMLRFTLRMFATGKATIPRLGMQEIPNQLAAQLTDHPNAELRLNTRVTSITPTSATLDTGETVHADAVILATDMTTAHELLPDTLKHLAPERNWRSTATLAFDAPTPPIKDRTLVLHADHEPGDPDNPINHTAVISNVSPDYAPPGRALIYANTTSNPPIDDAELEHLARQQLTRAFGPQVNDWNLITTVRIPHALPELPPGTYREDPDTTGLPPTLRIAGDHTTNNSINGAMRSGRLAAESLISELADL